MRDFTEAQDEQRCARQHHELDLEQASVLARDRKRREQPCSTATAG
jgi:hypothetical protein